MKRLTPRQAFVLRTLWNLTLDLGYPPTVRELGAALSIPNPHAVAGHLRALERKGRIAREAGKARAIRLVVS